jgi:putative NADPH-quinone reductase
MRYITMTKRIVIVQGHPDPQGNHLCHALADSYAKGAREAGHNVQRIDVASLEFPLLRTKEAFENGAIPPALQPSQQAIGEADHLVMIYPLWLGEMPALLKGFCEQIFRPGFAFQYIDRGFPIKRMKGKSARIVVTMGMPAIAYRWYFRAHGLKNLKRNILGFCGFAPIRDTLFGMVENASPATRAKWLEQMALLGKRAL